MYGVSAFFSLLEVYMLICDGMGYFGCARAAIPLSRRVSSIVDKRIPLCSFKSPPCKVLFLSARYKA